MAFSANSAAFRAKRLVGDPGPHGVTAGYGSDRELVSLHLDLVGAAASSPVGEDQRKGRSDFFFHGDPKTFVRELPHFYRLRYREVWPGVDLIFRVWDRSVEMQPVVRDEAAVKRMAYRWRGAPIAKATGGGITLGASWGAVRQLAPQVSGGGRLSGAYRRDQNGVVLFA